MKGKKSNYILIGVIVALWIAIYFRFTSHEEEQEYYVPQKTQVAKVKSDNLPTTFTVLANYRDPFTGKLRSKPDLTYRVVKKQPKSKPIVEEEIEVIINWPQLDYKGLVNSKSKSVGVLTHKGKDRIVMIGDSLDGICVQSLTMDSINLSYMGEFKSIY